MAWLTSLDSGKRIIRDRRKDAIYSYLQTGSLTPGSTSGGLTWTQTVVGSRTITVYEYPGIDIAHGPGLADGLIGSAGTKEARFQYMDGGMGSVFWTVEVRTFT